MTFFLGYSNTLNLSPRSITVVTFCFRVFRFDFCMKRLPPLHTRSRLRTTVGTCPPLPQDDFLACVAGTMDGRNWIIIQYYCQLLRWLRFGLRLCWSQSVSLVGVQKLVSFFSISKFSNPFPFSTFHFELTYKQNCEQLFFWSTNSRY